ncbi:hypothetical protein GBA52_028928 [Prunus armeniaca]|nr:hypothetical protein GBA52_028928 [Prunus armeniaca]
MAVKPRHARLQTRKTSSSSSTLVLTLLVMFTFVILILLALGILSVPSGSSGNSAKANDLSSIVRKSADRNEEEGQGEQWVKSSHGAESIYLSQFLGSVQALEHFCKEGVIKLSGTLRRELLISPFLPVEHGRGLQVLHYEVGQKYEPHYDYFQDEFNTGNGGQRVAYGSHVPKGGETVFPAAKGNISSVPWWDELSECGKKGLSVKPQDGDALLFWSMRPDASLDPSSLHGGCPVIKGNKWSSTKWVRVNVYLSTSQARASVLVLQVSFVT